MFECAISHPCSHLMAYVLETYEFPAVFTTRRVRFYSRRQHQKRRFPLAPDRYLFANNIPFHPIQSRHAVRRRYVSSRWFYTRARPRNIRNEENENDRYREQLCARLLACAYHQRPSKPHFAVTLDDRGVIFFFFFVLFGSVIKTNETRVRPTHLPRETARFIRNVRF